MIEYIFSNRNTPRSFMRSAATVALGMAAGAVIGLGIGMVGAPCAFADDPVPAPAPVPAASNQMGNAFLQMLNSMLGRVVPGADSIIPSNLPDQLPVPGPAPAVPVPGAPAAVGQTVT